ncbi:MAG: hypothetical protein MMC33_008683 [Icmadophila ericetorum]|nr:hypothetical protein [Icmadophila ericetorum]
MDAFISRKKRKLSQPTGPDIASQILKPSETEAEAEAEAEEDSTDLKLAILSSLYPLTDQEILLDTLIFAEGSVQAASQVLDGINQPEPPSVKTPISRGIGYQSSLSAYKIQQESASKPSMPKATSLTKKGQTLHLYDPVDIASHTPCSIIHNFLPPQEAIELLKELLEEAPTFGKQVFKLFDNVVTSPHSACFYVESLEEQKRQETEYLYNGSFLTDIRQITPHMRAVSSKVKDAVNKEIQKRIKEHYPNGKKLNYQSPDEWTPNAAFVNCYKGGNESVGYHSDQLTYLGPRAVIGSISLGVAREFRVRKIVGRDDDGEGSVPGNKNSSRADAEGQIAIHLPHNSLLVMHAEMQEEWKHSIHPAFAIDPHPVAGNKRINITYRYYRETFHPRYTPKCKCNIASVLRCVQRKRENRGRYMWMCHAGAAAGDQKGCSFFQWAEFDDDGNPPWVQKGSVGS